MPGLPAPGSLGVIELVYRLELILHFEDGKTCNSTTLPGLGRQSEVA
jgi:hypothetical protein